MNDERSPRPGRVPTAQVEVTASDDVQAFARFLSDHGALDPGVELGRLLFDLPALLGFLADHPELAEDRLLVASASVALGEAVIAAHPDARWVFTPEAEIQGPAMNLVIGAITANMITDRAAHAGLLETLAGWPQARLDEDELERLDDLPGPPLSSPPVGFVMPDLTVPTFADDGGRVIDYGNRYPDGSPDEAYSRTSHLERFAPLHDVAEALVAYLETHYDVVVTTGRDPDSRVIRLDPPIGAPVRLTFTDFPGIALGAGAFFAGHYPSCGCDACDETVEAVAEELVEELLGIAAGGLSEHYPVGTRGWSQYGLATSSGRSSGSGEPDFGPDDAVRATALLAGLDGGRWPPWPLWQS